MPPMPASKTLAEKLAAHPELEKRVSIFTLNQKLKKRHPLDDHLWQSKSL